VDDAELVGGVLLDVPDPVTAAGDLEGLLTQPRNRLAAVKMHLDPDLVDVLRSYIGSDRDRIRSACVRGAAWVLGRRSVTVPAPWDLVASLPAGTPLPPGLRRTTGETLMQLVTQATSRLRLAAPFIDRGGTSFLAHAFVAATARQVSVQVLLPTRSTHAADALDELKAMIALDGDIGRFSVARLRNDAPWAHLKVLTADSVAAYIGSANVTSAGIAGPNLELGILVRGPAVAVVEQVLDLFRQG
jgi:phosphatidylserine/phosphatidylglycerophosphate/cardiolipin synthase-like enzyme